MVPPQDWITRFTEIQEIFPPWVTALITNFPARFTSMKACWTAINTEVMRQVSSRKTVASDRILQLADPDSAGAMESYVDDSTFFNIEEAFQGTNLCAISRVQGCWRCGSTDHLRVSETGFGSRAPRQAAEYLGQAAWARTCDCVSCGVARQGPGCCNECGAHRCPGCNVDVTH